MNKTVFWGFIMKKSKTIPFVTAAILSLSLCTSAFAADLPEVKILATGGTIAGTASSDTQMTGYKAGVLGIDTLLQAVPAINNIAVVSRSPIPVAKV